MRVKIALKFFSISIRIMRWYCSLKVTAGLHMRHERHSRREESFSLSLFISSEGNKSKRPATKYFNFSFSFAQLFHLKEKNSFKFCQYIMSKHMAQLNISSTTISSFLFGESHKTHHLFIQTVYHIYLQIDIFLHFAQHLQFIQKFFVWETLLVYKFVFYISSEQKQHHPWGEF
jgi:hypothetical protein